MKVAHKEEEVKEGVERTADEIQDGEIISQTPAAEKEYPFTVDEVQELQKIMNDIRGNQITIEHLSLRNREHSEALHKRIREIHPDLLDKEYLFNPTTNKIQFRKEQ